MIDCFKLLEVDEYTPDVEIRRKYLEKVDNTKYKDIYDFSFKRKFYEQAYLTLLDSRKKKNHIIELRNAYNNKVDLESIIHFSDNPIKEREIIKKIEASIFEHLLVNRDFSCDESFSKYIYSFNKNHLEEIRQIDKNAILSTLNIYPFFIVDYDLVNKNNIKVQTLKK